MEYYDSFAQYSLDPFQEYEDFQVALMKDSFDNSSTYYTDIEQEIEFGSLEFRKIQVRITNVLESKVGDKVEDDYKKLIFPTINFEPKLGSRYKFDDNIWIVYQINNIKSMHSSCYVRRCNNVINTQDKYGRIHSEPCILDIKPTKSSILERQDISYPYSRQILKFQLNEWTKDIFINTRIIFNRQAFKVGSVMDFDRQHTFDLESARFVTVYLDDDLINEFDNKELQIADFKKINYNILTLEDLEENLGITNKLEAQVQLNEEIVQEELIWSTENEDIVQIDTDGTYTTLEEGEANITACLKEAPEIKTSIVMTVTSNPEIKSENKILPMVEYIPLNSVQNYEVYEYKNGIKTSTKFDIEFSGIKDKYYSKEIFDNGFSIKNLLQNDNNLLRVECTNRDTLEKVFILIELGGLF